MYSEVFSDISSEQVFYVDSNYNRWRQNSNPTTEIETNDDGSRPAEGYTTQFTGYNLGLGGTRDGAGTLSDKYWGGLVKSSYNQSYLDGSTYNSTWWYCVACVKGDFSYNNRSGMPGSGLSTRLFASNECLLFVRYK